MEKSCRNHHFLFLLLAKWMEIKVFQLKNEQKCATVIALSKSSHSIKNKQHYHFGLSHADTKGVFCLGRPRLTWKNKKLSFDMKLWLFRPLRPKKEGEMNVTFIFKYNLFKAKSHLLNIFQTDSSSRFP